MKKDKNINPRLGTVGGQAVLEGVMMKSKDRYSVAVRRENGKIAVSENRFVSVKSKNKFLRIPIIRGIVNFVEMMILSYGTLNLSASIGDLTEGDPNDESNKPIGKKMLALIMTIASVLGVVLGLGLFFFLPIVITKGINNLANDSLGLWKNVIEGLIKIIIFVSYIALVSLMKDIRRTFEYHGAEHKSIFCYESGEELTPENVKKFRRFHPRCGTSFIFVLLILGIFINSLPFVTWENSFLRLLTKLLLLPIIVGIGYEFIMYAGKHENTLTKILSAPGLWMQRLTTREPDEKQIEVAIAALKSALPDEFPDFKPDEIYDGDKKRESDDKTDIPSNGIPANTAASDDTPTDELADVHPDETETGKS